MLPRPEATIATAIRLRPWARYRGIGGPLSVAPLLRSPGGLPLRRRSAHENVHVASRHRNIRERC